MNLIEIDVNMLIGLVFKAYQEGSDSHLKGEVWKESLVRNFLDGYLSFSNPEVLEKFESELD